LTNAANVELEAIWATLLAKALEGKNIKDLLSNVGAGGGAPAVGIAPAAGGGGAPAAAAEEAKEEEKAEEKEESDDDMVSTRQLNSMHSRCVADCQHRLIGLWAVRLNSFPLAILFPLYPHHHAYTMHQSKIFGPIGPYTEDRLLSVLVL
jgi:ribosomal protein L12E/L44/L45/RPP1/RPP2